MQPMSGDSRVRAEPSHQLPPYDIDLQAQSQHHIENSRSGHKQAGRKGQVGLVGACSVANYLMLISFMVMCDVAVMRMRIELTGM